MINKIFKTKYYPVIFQTISLVLFVLLITIAIGISTDDLAILKQLRNTNLSNLIVWSYWWPLIILSTVLFGRHWCTICPIELISFLVEKVGLKKKIPNFIKTGWIVPILYGFISIVAIHTWGIHRSPNRMAIYLLFLMGLAIISSFFFKNRAFCSYFCPVGKLLGLYSLLAKWGIRIKNQDTCNLCDTKDCINKKNQYKLVNRSCNSGLYPANINNNRNCILCTQCIKSCPKDNIGFTSISPLEVEYKNIKWSEIAMLIILIGFVCYENMSSWHYTNDLIRYIPSQIYELSNFKFIHYNLFEGLIIFLLLPILILSLLSLILKFCNNESFGKTFKSLTFILLPIIGFGHLFKALLKMSSRIPYWKYALNEPNGLKYAKKIVNNSIQIEPLNWMKYSIVIIGIIGLFYASMLAIKLVGSDHSKSTFYKCIYLIIIFAFLFLFLSGPISNFIL